MAEETKKRKRARRNYAETVKFLESYCQASIDLLKPGGFFGDSDYAKGQVKAFEAVLDKIGGLNG